MTDVVSLSLCDMKNTEQSAQSMKKNVSFTTWLDNSSYGELFFIPPCENFLSPKT